MIQPLLSDERLLDDIAAAADSAADDADYMRILNLQLRFLLPLVLTLVAAAYLALPLMDDLTLRWFARVS